MSSPPSATLPRFAFLTPRTLPPASKIEGRVAVLDVAFASEGGGASFEKTTLPFIKGLGGRLAAWVDHHDHDRHVDYKDDPRFVLTTKAEHGACPELVTPEVVRAAGPVDTVAMHLDLDGIYSGAKWVLGGVEPYEGADADARAVDTRRGEPGPIATRIDRALRARFRDETLKHRVIQYLVARAKAPVLWGEIEEAAREIDPLLDEAKRLAEQLPDHRRLRLRRGGRAAVRQDGALAHRAGAGAGGGGSRLGIAGDRRRLRVGPRLREDVRPRRRDADPGDDPRGAPPRSDGEARRRGRRPGAAAGRRGVSSGMATRRKPQESGTHAALAARVLSAAGGLRAGLASEGPLPSRRDVRALVEELLEVLFPESHRLGTDGGSLQDHVAATIGSLEAHLETAIFLGLHRLCGGKDRGGARCAKRARATTARLLEALPDIRASLAKDLLAAFECDPAASGVDEIVACYPGLYAIAIYRVAHHLRNDGAQVVPRMLTEYAHSRTGIDIHPGATIGESFFIDHGTGIVVGETCRIGDRVRIYQGVTLGALSVRDRSKTDGSGPGKQRHPTIEDDVTIYANATILGGNTVIGRGATVGGNAWITYSVPPGIRVGVGT